MQRVPMWRGSRLAMTQAAAPVSVIAQASTSGKPKRASNGAWCLRVDAGAEAEADAMRARRRSAGGCSRIAGITPR